MDGATPVSPIPQRGSSMGFRQTPTKIPQQPFSGSHWTNTNGNGHTSPTNPLLSHTPVNGDTNGNGMARPQQPSSNHSFGSDLIDHESRTWATEKEKVLLGPYDYMESHPGKDIRSHLIAAFNAWLQVPPESLAVITKVVGMLHTSSLLVDDVEDGSQLRRGVPVAHSIFGTAQTINSANYVYFLALEELQKLHNDDAIKIFTEELINLHRGQGMDLWWRDTLTCPTEAEYLEMVDNKTGGLFRLAVKLMQAESTTGCNCVPLVNAVGLLFQILDDYKNLSSTIYTQNKGLAEDLTEGKFSFPIIHCIRSDPSNHILINILKQKPEEHQIKRYAISYMESTGSFAYTRDRLQVLTARALELVDEMERSSCVRESGIGMRKILEKMKVTDDE